MRRSLMCVLIALAVLPAAPAAANHVSATVQSSAQLGERISDNSWMVIVNWAVNCSGPTGPATYYGSLNLDDIDSGEVIYMGGIFSASDSEEQPVTRRTLPRHMRPRIKASCGDSGALPHGSETIEAQGNAVTVPATGDENGDGLQDGGSGGRLPGGTPTRPLRSGGCERLRVGTARSETLNGTSAADLIHGLGGNDLIRGGGDDDCLIGGPGKDRLVGGAGYDRLTGGSGADTLSGGTGVNRYDAGAGNDFVNAVNRRAELVSCGSGRDRARVDRGDRVRSCERVRRSR